MHLLKIVLLLLLLGSSAFFTSTATAQSKNSPVDKFRQLEEILPTPNEQRTGSGAPGHQYWQQRADYVMEVELDDKNQRLTGSETITYYNQSPDVLTYLWLQLDQNHFRQDADAKLTQTVPKNLNNLTLPMIAAMTSPRDEFGYNITAVKDAKGAPLAHAIVKTMMRVDLKEPLKPKQSVTFAIDWNFKIVEAKKFGARSGWEYFAQDGNYLYGLAQFFPRMAAYNDVT
ncbi:MAG TPA: aminopeptidase, partial [Blastocatellia bacterium]|nr:aminopeptidase [Blastocatellia bacterium]